MVYFLGNQVDAFSNMSTCKITDVVEYCQDKKILGVDIETTGLSCFSDKMLMFQIGDKSNQFIIDTRYISIRTLAPILSSKSIVKILHNSKFDYKFVRVAGIVLENVYDTYLNEVILSCGKVLPKGYHALNTVIERRLGVPITKAERSTFIGMTDQPFTEAQIIYGAKDVEYLIDIYEQQLLELTRDNLMEISKLENEAVLAFGDIEYNGIGLDTTKWMKLADTAKTEALQLHSQLDGYVLKDASLSSKYKAKYIQGDLFLDVLEQRNININWDSPTQVLKVFKHKGLDITDVNAKNLHKHRTDPFIDEYIVYKEKMKLSSSYGEEFLKNVNPSTGRIHTNFKQILETGRVSSSSPNVQQIPSDNKYRNCFISGLPDWVFVSADYSSQELCLIAQGSKDPVWLDALERGEDLHSICAALVFSEIWEDVAEEGCAYFVTKSKCNCKEHKRLRNSIKTISFGLCYGMSSMKLADTLLISQTEAQETIDLYFKAFPNIKKFLDSLSRYGISKGYILTYAPYRRRRYFSNWGHDMSFKDKGIIERASRNTPIQGAGSDMVKQSLIFIRDEIKANNWQVKIVMTVHDQIDTIVHKDQAEEWKIKMTELMEQAANIIITTGLLKAETEISEVWKK